MIRTFPTPCSHSTDIKALLLAAFAVTLGLAGSSFADESVLQAIDVSRQIPAATQPASKPTLPIPTVVPPATPASPPPSNMACGGPASPVLPIISPVAAPVTTSTQPGPTNSISAANTLPGAPLPAVSAHAVEGPLTSGSAEPDTREKQKSEDNVSLGNLTSGLVTTEMLDAEPYSFRVTWNNWDSGFRDTGLQIGDRVLGVNDVRYDRHERDRWLSYAVGVFDDNYWPEIRAKDGQQVTLTVKRGLQILTISGQVRAHRTWTNKNQNRLFGPGGPVSYLSAEEKEALKDEYGWLQWYDRLVAFQSGVLDGGWRNHIDSRVALRRHMEERDRIDYLLTHYPGPFADRVQQDWVRTRDSLLGVRYELSDKDLAYRQPGGASPAQPAPMPAPDADPAEVLAHNFAALKAGAKDVWRSLYSPWIAKSQSDGSVKIEPNGGPSSHPLDLADDLRFSEWKRARDLITGKVYDLRVVGLDDVQRWTSSSGSGTTVVEQVLVEVDHVGHLNGEYRSFNDSQTHRVWRLQRRDGGPWRIIDPYGI